MDHFTKSAAKVREAVPFFAVANMEESLRYYVDGLGFEISDQWMDEGKLRWCWLRHGEASLMLQEFCKEGRHAWVPEGKVGEGVSIYFICEDALETYREIRSRGVEATRPQVGNGMWVTSLADPDGYRLYFESDAPAPEETEYAGEP